MPTEKSPEQRTIAQLNDEFRRRQHDWYITSGAQSLPDVPGLLQAVHDFNTFTPDNDPYPLDPDCRRVLTVLLASEY